jgi:hypothetical protein
MQIHANDYKFWFSHKVNRYETIEASPGKKTLRKTSETVKLDWDKCTLDVVGQLPNGKTRIVFRSKSTKISKYMGDKPVGIRYMLGIDVLKASKPKIEQYELSEDNSKVRDNFDAVKEQTGKNQRIVFQLDEKFWVWDWYDGKEAIEKSEIYKIYQMVSSQIESSKPFTRGLFNIDLENEIDEAKTKISSIIPIIYQPAMDSLKNYVREVHCAPVKQNIIEVSIIFNNEQLRKFKIVNKLYERFRLLKYGRTFDIETFRICNDDNLKDTNKNYFIFENIYSDAYGIEYDTIHSDPRIAPPREIKYMSKNLSNPIIFINTSNHAMSESDNNHDLWKWEYIPFTKDAPLKFGTKSRSEIEGAFTSIFSKIANLFR